jgi:hypothetical protein
MIILLFSFYTSIYAFLEIKFQALPPIHPGPGTAFTIITDIPAGTSAETKLKTMPVREARKILLPQPTSAAFRGCCARDMKKIIEVVEG